MHRASGLIGRLPGEVALTPHTPDVFRHIVPAFAVTRSRTVPATTMPAGPRFHRSAMRPAASPNDPCSVMVPPAVPKPRRRAACDPPLPALAPAPPTIPSRRRRGGVGQIRLPYGRICYISRNSPQFITSTIFPRQNPPINRRPHPRGQARRPVRPHYRGNKAPPGVPDGPDSTNSLLPRCDD